MNQLHRITRWAWSILVVGTLAFAMSGCEGDDGATGPPGSDGSDGSDGAPGAPGPEGPPGPGAAIIPLESCGVCHDDGSFASAPDYHALDPIESVAVTGFGQAANEVDLEIYFDVEVDGALTAGYDRVNRGYYTDGVDRFDICESPDSRAGEPCNPDLLTISEVGGGSYMLTAVDGWPEGGVFEDIRALFRVSIGNDRATRVYFFF